MWRLGVVAGTFFLFLKNWFRLFFKTEFKKPCHASHDAKNEMIERKRNLPFWYRFTNVLFGNHWNRGAIVSWQLQRRDKSCCQELEANLRTRQWQTGEPPHDSPRCEKRRWELRKACQSVPSLESPPRDLKQMGDTLMMSSLRSYPGPDCGISQNLFSILSI